MELFYNQRFLTFSLSSLGVWTWALPIMLGLIFLRSLHVELRWLLYLSVFSIAFEYISATPWALNKFETPTNYPYYHLVTPVYFWFHLKIFKPLLLRYFSQQLINGVLIAFILFCCWNAFWGDGLLNFNGQSLALLSSSCILIGASFFIYLLRTLSTERPEELALFWLSVGTVIYYSGSFLLWLAVKYINFSRSEFDSLYNIHSALSILLHLFYSMAIWKDATNKNQNLLTVHS